MKQKSWLNYLNIFAVSIPIVLIIAIIALSAFGGFGYFAMSFVMFAFWPAILIIAGIILYGLIIITFFNFVAAPQGKSAWSLFMAVALLLLLGPLSLFLIGFLNR
ncbi:MAG TPA: hypothetical protein VK249_19460 [Anaerolineales bacterium]|nr:hypothetical protein [Anaerolineales bacterium]